MVRTEPEHVDLADVPFLPCAECEERMGYDGEHR